jgi:hypothetical protein
MDDGTADATGAVKELHFVSWAKPQHMMQMQGVAAANDRRFLLEGVGWNEESSHEGIPDRTFVSERISRRLTQRSGDPGHRGGGEASFGSSECFLYRLSH